MKFSSVFQKTVKAVEELKRKEKRTYEEGELSDTSEEEQSGGKESNKCFFLSLI